MCVRTRTKSLRRLAFSDKTIQSIQDKASVKDPQTQKLTFQLLSKISCLKKG
jgi:hypothetical protein